MEKLYKFDFVNTLLCYLYVKYHSKAEYQFWLHNRCDHCDQILSVGKSYEVITDISKFNSKWLDIHILGNL